MCLRLEICKCNENMGYATVIENHCDIGRNTNMISGKREEDRMKALTLGDRSINLVDNLGATLGTSIRKSGGGNLGF